MVALYVVSSERAAGKTAICAGVGKYLLDDGMHYSPDGAAVVAQIVYNHIIQYLNSKGGRR